MSGNFHEEYGIEQISVSPFPCAPGRKKLKKETDVLE
jgi:hypothetical protein